jgi:hypothetical protein
VDFLPQRTLAKETVEVCREKEAEAKVDDWESEA